MASGTSTLFVLITAGASAGAGAATVVCAGFASGEASGAALLAIALKPAIERERTSAVVNNFFIVQII